MRRREFLGGLIAAATAAPRPAGAEPKPETTRIRLRVGEGGFCTAPQYVAEEFLKGEGFTEVLYPRISQAERPRALASGDIDMDAGFIGNQIVRVDTGDPIVVLAGIHVGCFELFAHDTVRTVRDLKGKAVGVTVLGSGRHLFLASLMAHIGLDARKDVNLVVRSAEESVALFAERKIDAYQAFAEDVYDLRDRKLGRVLVNSTTDRPWAQYFCCTLVANREFVRKHPTAAKRAVRAILKATDVCALEPARAARVLVDRGWVKQYEPTRRMLAELPYDRWRRLDPEETVRFYALRLREAGLIKSSPQKIIAQGTDWQFLNELKKELKG